MGNKYATLILALTTVLILVLTIILYLSNVEHERALSGLRIALSNQDDVYKHKIADLEKRLQDMKAHHQANDGSEAQTVSEDAMTQLARAESEMLARSKRESDRQTPHKRPEPDQDWVVVEKLSETPTVTFETGPQSNKSADSIKIFDYTKQVQDVKEMMDVLQTKLIDLVNVYNGVWLGAIKSGASISVRLARRKNELEKGLYRDLWNEQDDIERFIQNRMDPPPRQCQEINTTLLSLQRTQNQYYSIATDPRGTLKTFNDRTSELREKYISIDLDLNNLVKDVEEPYK